MPVDRFSLEGRVALVTGAGKGIGRSIAQLLAEAGARVACCARTPSDIDETVGIVEKAGSEGLAVRCDVTRTEELDALVAATLERFGRIDVLVNNAGGMFPKPALDLSERAFEKIVRFNLTAPFLTIQRVVPHMMRTAGGGSIVNISSGASVQSIKGMAPYAAAKAGLNQLTRVLACEFAPEVRVNGIIVGQIQTEGAASVIPEAMLKQAASNIPMQRLGAPEDIASCALYLASPAAAWVTGRVIAVDGGAAEPPLAFPVPALRERFPDDAS
jgi:7-alpha-hydroxysteroid dehydrogenase